MTTTTEDRNARRRALYAEKKQTRTDAQAGANALANVAALNLNLRSDGFISQTTGAGISGVDKFTSYTFSAAADLDDECLADLYRDNDIAAKIVELVTKDALRNGYSLESGDFSDGEAADIVEQVETEFKLTNAVERARIYGRLFGGGAVMIGSESGKLTSQREDEKTMKFLRPVSRVDLTSASWDADVASKGYSRVLSYDYKTATFTGEVNGQPTTVGGEMIEAHTSYFAEFYGVLTTDKRFRELEGWGDSVLRRAYEAIKQFEAAYSAVLHALAESSVPVYKVEGLLRMLASENSDLLAARFALLNAGKSNYRAIVLGENEEFERVAAQLAEAANVVGAAMNRVSGASGMPSTVLWGQSPQGMNSTGTSDLEIWNQQVAKEQTLELGPVILDLYRAILSDPEGPTGGEVPDDLAVRFPPLLTPSIQDQVNNYAQVAGADVGYVTAQVLKPEEVALSRAKQKGTLFPSIDIDKLEAGLATDAENSVVEENALASTAGGLAAPESPEAGSPDALDIPAGSEPQKAALNGAQISGLVAIATTAADGTLPLETAKAIAAASYPLDAAALDAIFGPLPDGKCEEEEAKPDPINPLLGLGAPAPGEEEDPKAPAPGLPPAPKKGAFPPAKK